MIPPGSTIGILGGGQLGRMTVLAGRRMGYRFNIFEPNAGCAAGMVADLEVNAPYSDLHSLRNFASQVDVVTLEFENIPLSAVEVIAERVPLHPSGQVLHICQHRQREKDFLSQSGFPCVPFDVVKSSQELAAAVIRMRLPCVLKTASFGYDGKGQRKIDSTDQDFEAIWHDFGSDVGIIEKWISFRGEYSVICAINEQGEGITFPMSENIHRDHILHTSIVPARIEADKQREAEDLAMKIAKALDLVGLLAVELFLTQDNEWLVNELAPRPHNSGHYSFDACLTNQFEQHVRAVCGLPLGATTLLSPVVMVNLLGELWNPDIPEWNILLRDPTVKLHLYDKGSPRAGRKMGHYCVLDESINTAVGKAENIFEALGRTSGPCPR